MLRRTTIFATAREHHDPPSQGSHQYHKVEYAWSLGIESRPAMGIGKPETAEYGAYWDDDVGYHQILPQSETAGSPIVGRIAISEGSHESVEHVASALQSRLHKKHTSLDAGSDSEDWFRHALHQLQEEKILTSFDREAFFKYAHGYLASRQSQDSDAPLTIVYPALHSHPKQQHRSGFWISRPTSGSKSEGGLYGGLM